MAEDYFISLKLLCVAWRAMLFYCILGATYSNETQSHFNQSFLHTFVRFPFLAAVVSCRHSQLFSRIHQKRSHSHAWYCAQLFYFIIGDILAGDVPHTVRRRSWFFCMSLPISIWCYDSCGPGCVCVCLYRFVVIFFCLLFTIFPFVFFYYSQPSTHPSIRFHIRFIWPVFVSSLLPFRAQFNGCWYGKHVFVSSSARGWKLLPAWLRVYNPIKITENKNTTAKKCTTALCVRTRSRDAFCVCSGCPGPLVSVPLPPIAACIRTVCVNGNQKTILTKQMFFRQRCKPKWDTPNRRPTIISVQLWKHRTNQTQTYFQGNDRKVNARSDVRQPEQRAEVNWNEMQCHVCAVWLLESALCGDYGLLLFRSNFGCRFFGFFSFRIFAAKCPTLNACLENALAHSTQVYVLLDA